jgi:hypothetical protein
VRIFTTMCTLHNERKTPHRDRAPHLSLSLRVLYEKRLQMCLVIKINMEIKRISVRIKEQQNMHDDIL